MLKQDLKVHSKIKLQEHIYSMTLIGDCSKISAPGQFINIKLDNHYLRRPISVYSYGEDYVTIVFKVVGDGTKDMSLLKKGHVLDVLIPLGNGFDTTKSGKSPLLVGGGIGVPPLFGLAEELLDKGITPKVVMGFGSSEDVILEKEFEAIGITPLVTTMDGSAGTKGVVTDVMKNLEYDYIYTCGPEPMLKAVYDHSPAGQFSFEARMACGFGACMGCTCETLYGYKRICKDGPVLFKEEIKW